MKNLPLLLGTIFATLALIIGVAVLFSKQNPEGPTAVQADESTLLTGARHFSGSDEAAVTIVEFSDFQCPACKASQPAVKQVLAQYPNDVRLVFRHFPLDSIHPFARLAAIASEAAADQDKFWQYHDLLFERQQAWSSLDSVEAVRATLLDYATELELDKDQFLAKMDSETVVALVNEDAAAADQLGIMATPTFFVAGYQTSAPELLEAVTSLINQNTNTERAS